MLRAIIRRLGRLLVCNGKCVGKSQMILHRAYDPPVGELIYHYCRPEAFLEIVRHRVMWFSAYYVMNDALEREWGYNLFSRVLESLRGEMGYIAEAWHAVAVSRITNGFPFMLVRDSA
jgi:hypothetical protein